jgi:hypothetical protein
MKKSVFAAVPVALMLALSACGGNYAEVVRFHSNAPISRGTLAIVPPDAAMADSLEFRTNAETVAVQMRRIGYTTGLPLNQVQYVATLDITQTDGAGNVTRPGAPNSAPVAAPASSSRRNPAKVTTTMSVQIRNRTTNATVWEGRASHEAEAGSRNATTTIIVPELAKALFGDFPGMPGVTKRVTL